MGFWEKGYFSSAIIIFLTGMGYAAHVWLQSSRLGTLAAPELVSFLVALIVCIAVSAISFVVISAVEARHAAKGEKVDGYDERDMLVSLHAKSGSLHALSFGVYMSLVAFFVHGDGAILFYSIFAATIFADIIRCLLQIHYYNRPI